MGLRWLLLRMARGREVNLARSWPVLRWVSTHLHWSLADRVGHGERVDEGRSATSPGRCRLVGVILELSPAMMACCPRYFGWLGSTHQMSNWSSPPAAMAAGLDEGDGAPYGCSGGAPKIMYL
ncbi:hypothetical protein ACLOJK_028343 [Asimina triloba]